jgi:hypothetical protein
LWSTPHVLLRPLRSCHASLLPLPLLQLQTLEVPGLPHVALAVEEDEEGREMKDLRKVLLTLMQRWRITLRAISLLLLLPKVACNMCIC